MFIDQTTLVIPTKDRVLKLKRFFYSLGEYVNLFNEIIIVDSSCSDIHSDLKMYYSIYKNITVTKSEASSSKQRNLGIKKYNKKNKYIMFCDDDIIFEKNSIINMNQFILNNPNYVGYGFNLIENPVNNFFERLKKGKFIEKIGIYNPYPGIVCANGWHTKISNVKSDLKTIWLSTQACIFKTEFFDMNTYFEDSLGSYSYLEDLFFSYEMGKKGDMIVSSSSQYTHPDNIERSDFKFGQIEVVNRYKFVIKNNFSTYKFYITILLKVFFTFLKIITFKIKFFPKFFGNISGIILCILKLKR